MNAVNKIIAVRVFGVILAFAAAAVCGYVMVMVAASEMVIGSFTCAASGFVLLAALGVWSLMNFGSKPSKSTAEKTEDTD